MGKALLEALLMVLLAAAVIGLFMSFMLIRPGLV